MKNAVLGLLSSAVIALSGCGGVSIKPEQVNAIRSTTVSPQIKLADGPSHHGPENAGWGRISGLIGTAGAAWVSALGKKDPQGQIKAYLDAERIDVGEIVRAQFGKGLATDPRFSNKVRENGETKFELEVFLYGLISDGPFSNEYKPWLGVRAKLIDASGNVMWEAIDFTTSFSKSVPMQPYLTYFESPENFRSAFAAAADMITKGLLSKL